MNEKGLSLVEMIITIAIIAILAGIAVLTWENTAATKADTQRKNDLAVIQNALQKYFANTLNYPSTLAFPGTLSDGIQTYNIPADPKTGWRQYCYNPTIPSGATSFQKYTLNAKLQRVAAGSTTYTCDLNSDFNYQVKNP